MHCLSPISFIFSLLWEESSKTPTFHQNKVIDGNLALKKKKKIVECLDLKNKKPCSV
jgi:hypothetical protein